MSVTVADIVAARRTIAGHVLRTPMLPAPKLSALTGSEVYVKYENLQVTNSFKERGALNKLASLGDAERARGVIAMSAGNHAQAVAYHAARLRIPATIVMPVTTPFVKVEATQAYGAEVVLEGETIADAQVRAESIARERDLIWVHPYDDARVIAGQGTIAFEMLEETPVIDEVLTPDSSRFWPRTQYEPGHGQPSFDKQFVRDYLEEIRWNKQPPVPSLPDEVVRRTRDKYVEAYRLLSGRELR